MLTKQAKNGHEANDKMPIAPMRYGDDELDISQEMLNEIWQRRAYELAQEPKAEAFGQTIDLLAFHVGQEHYGIDVTNVREIYPLERLTYVPRTPDFVAGVFSARGRIISVIDLHVFLGLSPTPHAETSKIIVVASNRSSSENVALEIGILVEAVDNVITIFKDEIEPPLISHHNNYTQGITRNLLEVLDLNVLLEEKRLIVNDEVK